MSTYTLIHLDGREEERPYLIKDGKEYVSEHISRREFDTGSEDNCRVFEPLVELFEKVRFGIQKPIPVNSGYRSIERQEWLYSKDLAQHGGKPSGKVAKPGHSPHHTGAAMDLGIPQGWSADKFADLLVHTAQGMGFGAARVGYVQYGKRFVHLDLVYLLYEPYIKGRKNPHPSWKPGVKW